MLHAKEKQSLIPEERILDEESVAIGGGGGGGGGGGVPRRAPSFSRGNLVAIWTLCA
jgi:hypothetical protein